MSTPAADTPAMTMGRQIRMTAEEHAALMAAAPRGEQNRYIMTAVRKQLRRDGHLTAADDKQASLPLRRVNGRRRPRRVTR